MTGPDDAAAPHSAAEQDPSRAANQLRDEAIPPSFADEDMPAADSDQPDTSTADDSADAASAGETERDRPQAGVPESTVTDTTPALGTSEQIQPVQGVHTPDGAGGGADRHR